MIVSQLQLDILEQVRLTQHTFTTCIDALGKQYPPHLVRSALESMVERGALQLSVLMDLKVGKQ